MLNLYCTCHYVGFAQIRPHNYVVAGIQMVKQQSFHNTKHLQNLVYCMVVAREMPKWPNIKVYCPETLHMCM